jgi:hypothetical protein
MFLDRSRTNSLPFIFDQNTGGVLLDAEDLDTSERVFPYFRLIHECCCRGLDIGFLGGDSWHTQRDAGGTVSPAFSSAGLVIVSTTPGTVFHVDYGTDFWTADVNYRHVLNNCTTLVAGFRWIELGDDLAVSRTINGVTEPIIFTDTNNHLYGFQLGLDTSLMNIGQRLQIEGTVRAGILGNHADQNTFAPFVSNTPGFVDSVSASTDETSFFGALGLQGVYYLNNGWHVLGGYQLFWIEQVALAPTQLAVTNLAIPPVAGIDATDGLVLSGAVFGLGFSY